MCFTFERKVLEPRKSGASLVPFIDSFQNMVLKANKKTSAEQNNEEMYFPERIVKDRINKGKKEYYVKWQGYDEAANTWEPQTNTSLKELIEEYENQKKYKNGI